MAKKSGKGAASKRVAGAILAKLRAKRGKCVWPTEYNVLIEPKKVDDMSKGGIIIPDTSKERDQFAQTEGVLVAISPLTFTYASEVEWGVADKPKPGDRVLFAKYSGTTVKGSDGKDYRLVKDKDITAVLYDGSNDIGD